jgi:hypothetical protein
MPSSRITSKIKIRTKIGTLGKWKNQGSVRVDIGPDWELPAQNPVQT